MTTAFNGGPVLGGTYPALIWHDFMTSALNIDKTRAEAAASGKGKSGESGEGSTTSIPEAATPTSAGSNPTPTGSGSGKGTSKSSAPSGGGEAGAQHTESAQRDAGKVARAGRPRSEPLAE